MIEGACDCGAVRWRIDAVPETATACNCRLCRRYGALWAYGHEDEDVHVVGAEATTGFVRGEAEVEFRFCGQCGCVTHQSARAAKDGRRHVGVNLRCAEPQAVSDIPLIHLDGLHDFGTSERRARTVAEIWF